VEIREARPEEYAAVGELTVEAYLSGGHVAADHDYVHRLRDAGARAADALLLVAVADGGLLGTVTYCPAGSPWREIAGPDEGEFRTLAVADGARGRGVGEALVRSCLDRSRADGDRAVVLSTLPDQSAAHRIYHRLGFERVPDRDWTPSPGVRLLAYRLELEAAAVPASAVGTASLDFTVTPEDTAAALGSGSLPVLGTPRLLAWCEAATCAALGPELAAGTTSVGTRVTLEHRAPSPVGDHVRVTASRTHADGRLHRFTVAAQTADGRVLATGEVTRVVVDSTRFLSRMQPRDS
jgi:predicted thioesterase/predicted N-acetyltransferase YhbS